MIFNKLLVYANKSSGLCRNMDKANSNTPIQTRFFSGVVPPTPDNVEQVAKVEKFVSLFQHQMLDLPKLTLLYKTLKAARLAMANRVLKFNTTVKVLVF